MIYDKKIEQMIERLRKSGISDENVLRAMQKVPRHLFVAPGMEFQAYEEKALPIGYGQTISHPFTVALMTQSLNVTSGERVLEIGTGSGYQAAILCELGCQVYTIEKVRELGLRAEKLLRELKYIYKFVLKIGDGSRGWPSHAPFDAIIITAGAPYKPLHLINQLKEGGRLLAPIGNTEEQTLTLFVKEGKEVKEIQIQKLRFVPLKGVHGW